MKVTLIVGVLTVVALSLLYLFSQPIDAAHSDNPLNAPDTQEER